MGLMDAIVNGNPVPQRNRRKPPTPILDGWAGTPSPGYTPSPTYRPVGATSPVGAVPTFDPISIEARRISAIAPRPQTQEKKERRTKVQARKVLGRPLPGLDAEQTGVASTILKVGLKRGATPQELLSAVETGIVESGLRNLDYGDADSMGWRQERTSIYGTGPKGPTNVRAAAKRYFDEARAAGQQPTAGQLAQATQQSAFPERYDQVEGQAQPVLNKFLKRADRVGLKNVPTVDTAPQQMGGAYAGSKRALKKLLGPYAQTEDWKDKEPGHSVGGLHDPANEVGYAGDLSTDEKLIDYVAKKLRKENPGLGEVDYGTTGLESGLTWKGYDVEWLPYTHGSGPHDHLGLEWNGGSLPEGTRLGGGTSTGGSTGYAPAPSTSGVTSSSSPGGQLALGLQGSRSRRGVATSGLKTLAFSASAPRPTIGREEEIDPLTGEPIEKRYRPRRRRG